MKALFGMVVILLFFNGFNVQGQDIEAALSGSSSAEGFTVLDKTNAPLFTTRGDGRVGIGTASPSFTLTLAGDGGIFAAGSLGTGQQLSVGGAGTRLIWYPRKAAFRVGEISGTHWNDANVGLHSMAFGKDTQASGQYSVAGGSLSQASGLGSIALGSGAKSLASRAVALGGNNTASGSGSLAAGDFCVASGNYAFAMGYQASASGDYAIAIGEEATASAQWSVAIGPWAEATGYRSFAAGLHAEASGNGSFVIGSNISSNGKSGSFLISDASTTSTMNATYTHRFYARFDNGYMLYTKSDRSTCLYAFNGATSWSSLSDSTRKENFRRADAEGMLRAFRSLRLGSWNYKGDDRRHYGPMAQEWFAAFGNDGVGTIGDDTTLATADVDGVLCIAVQALEQRTAASTARLQTLTRQLRERDREIAELRRRMTEQQHAFEQQLSERDSATEAKLARLEQMINRQDVTIQSLVNTLQEEQDVMQKRLAQQAEEFAQ